MTFTFPAHHEDMGKLLLRVVVGGLLLFHGVFKLSHGVAWIAEPLGQVGLPAFLRYGVYLGEVVAPVLVLVGYWTRPAALVIAFDLFMAIILVGRQRVLTVSERGGSWGVELEAFFLLTALVVFLLGAGKYSLSRGEGPLD
jgi:putative oxidoreductase